jgi:hypothetical protein
VGITQAFDNFATFYVNAFGSFELLQRVLGFYLALIAEKPLGIFLRDQPIGISISATCREKTYSATCLSAV